MNIKSSTAFAPAFNNNSDNRFQYNYIQPVKKKKSFLDNFETNIINSADLNDTVQVPRTIFKGYLAFMAGTALLAIGGLAKNKYPKTSNGLNILSAGLTVWGTFSFVRPYIIKGANTSKTN